MAVKKPEEKQPIPWIRFRDEVFRLVMNNLGDKKTKPRYIVSVSGPFASYDAGIVKHPPTSLEFRVVSNPEQEDIVIRFDDKSVEHIALQ